MVEGHQFLFGFDVLLFGNTAGIGGLAFLVVLLVVSVFLLPTPGYVQLLNFILMVGNRDH